MVVWIVADRATPFGHIPLVKGGYARLEDALMRAAEDIAAHTTPVPAVTWRMADDGTRWLAINTYPEQRGRPVQVHEAGIYVVALPVVDGAP